MKTRMLTVKALCRTVATALMVVGSIGVAHADGFVTQNLLTLDAIYGQASFGATPISFRFDSTINVFDSSLLVLTDAGFDRLPTYVPADQSASVISMFFVDGIAECGGPIDGIIGCGQTPGNILAVDSNAVAEQADQMGTSFGAVVEGHEIGHNLGLQHVEGDDTNLMNPGAYNGPAPAPLTADQVAQIFQSPLVQHDVLGYFIEIQPFAVLSSVSAVPESSNLAMMGLGLGVLAFLRKRKSS
jgi:hypothetical protein